MRELRNTVLRAMVLARGPRVTRADLHGIEPMSAETQADGFVVDTAAESSGRPPAVERTLAGGAAPSDPLAGHAGPLHGDVAIEIPRPVATESGVGVAAAGDSSPVPPASNVQPALVIPIPTTSDPLRPIVDPADGSRRREALLAFVRSRGEATSQECAAALAVSQRTALRLLVEATESGWLVRRGRRRGACYSLAEKSATAQVGPENSARPSEAGSSAPA